MSTTTVVYHSGFGNTERLAQAVAKGAERVATGSVALRKIEQESIVEGRFENEALFEEPDASDAIVFGAPTYTGMVSAQLGMVWADPAAPPSNLTNDGSDTDRWGFYLGLEACGSVRNSNRPDDGGRLTTELYGERTARATERWVSASTAERATKEATA